MSEQKYILMESSMVALKELRRKCLDFEDTLKKAMCKESEGGCQIIQTELDLLEWRLQAIIHQGTKTRLILQKINLAIRKNYLEP